MMCKHCSAPILVDGTSLSDSSQSSHTPPNANGPEPAPPVTSKAPGSADARKPATRAAAAQKVEPPTTAPQVQASNVAPSPQAAKLPAPPLPKR
ncbi:MAG TPA: hypothetical protein VKP30_32575, partial [Polyangiaceae bacterium]|nr:hypothetical protein [Polyangiaceae bacterium]